MSAAVLCANPHCNEHAVYWPGVCSLLCWADSVDLPAGYCVPDVYGLLAHYSGAPDMLTKREAENQ